MNRPRARSLSVVAVVGACLGAGGLTARSAHADTPSPLGPVEGEPATRDPPAVRKWYGDQTIAIDVASTVMTVGGLAAHSDGLAILGLATYGVGPPVVHAAHGRPEIMLASFFLRVGLPVATGFIGAEIANATLHDSRGNSADTLIVPVAGAAVGLPIGVLGAMVIDSTWLAWETKHPDRPKASSLTLEPRVAIDRDRGNALRETFGLAGTF